MATVFIIGLLFIEKYKYVLFNGNVRNVELYGDVQFIGNILSFNFVIINVLSFTINRMYYYELFNQIVAPGRCFKSSNVSLYFLNRIRLILDFLQFFFSRVCVSVPATELKLYKIC